jgi:hypothetical protein
VACPAASNFGRRITFGSVEVIEHQIPKGNTLDVRVRRRTRSKKPAAKVDAEQLLDATASALRNAMEMAYTQNFSVGFGIPVLWSQDGHAYVYQPYTDGRWHSDREREANPEHA